VASVFPGVDTARMLLIPTCQRADMDLVARGERVEDEKDRLLERFVAWAAALVAELAAAGGHWSDYADPCSGLPMVHMDNSTIVYGEVEALSVLLGYRTADAGGCKIVLHPRWGGAVYPATVFTQAPVEVVLAAVRAVEARLAGAPGLGPPGSAGPAAC